MSLIATRLAQLMPSLIHLDQCGFVPGRTTTDSIRKMLLLIQDAQVNGTSLGLASLAAEKAFDWVDLESLFLIMDRLKFPIQIIETLRNICI